MFGLIKRMFIGLFTSIVSASNHAKCILLNNRKCMIKPTLINLYPDEYSQELHYHPLAVNLDRCIRICNTLDELSNKVCVPDKNRRFKFIKKVLVSNKIYFGEKKYKQFIGYLYNNHKVKPLHIMLSKASAYVKSYDGQTKWMYFLIEDDDL